MITWDPIEYGSDTDLWHLAQTVAGGDSVTVDNRGRSFDPSSDRPVIVSAPADDDGTEEGPPDIVWCGFADQWSAALTEAITRPGFPGTIPGWEPGLFEGRANAASREEARRRDHIREHAPEWA